MAAAAHDPTSAMLEDYDVVLLAIDRRRENDLAFKIQNLMVVNMPVARKLIATATPSTPLVVIGKVSQRKADAVRRQLQELGATAAIRPTNAAEPSAPRK
jgi:hypothetical protein